VDAGEAPERALLFLSGIQSMAEQSSATIVSMTGIRKSFPGVQALKGVSLSVKAGEVHGLVGENGAGKSTLIKILMGAYSKDGGTITIEGREVEIHNPLQAKSQGMAAVYQDVMLARHLSAGENFFLGKLPRTPLGLVDWKKIHQVTRETLKDLDLSIDPRMLVRHLPPAQQEMVTIAKAVYEKSKVIVFDEPTALLTNEQVTGLFALIKKLKKKNVGVIYISHRLEEIFAICDRVTILKDGEWVETLEVSGTDQDTIITKMVGRSIGEMYSIHHPKRAEKVLEVRGLTREPRFRNVDFDLHQGEILGFFGLVGSGRTDILRCIFGADRAERGEIRIRGLRAPINSPQRGIRAGIGLLPENRQTSGLAMSLAVDINVNLASYDLISRGGFVNLGEEASRARRFVSDLTIRTPSIKQKVRNLSGGNQQKVVVAKWLSRNSDIFIFDEPTVGIDVGAKMEIYKLIQTLLAKGKAIILVSSYLPEVMGLGDRIIVVYEGNVTGTVLRSQFEEEKILRLASGIMNRANGEKL
jgi:ribose transport system ATP-binding protein